MNILEINPTEILAFLLVLVRISVFIALWPIFNVAMIPQSAKILIALGLSIMVFPVVEWKSLTAELDSLWIIAMVFREAMIAIILAFIARTLFFAVNVCGQLVSLSLGLSAGEVLNPSMDIRGSAVEQFQMMVATLLFLSWGGHHIFLKAMVDSFDILPLSTRFLNTIDAETLSTLLTRVVVVGIQLSGPVLATIFFMNIALGLIGRAVPQVNLLITSFPANIMIGFLILLVTVPAFFLGFENFTVETGHKLFAVLKSI